MTENQVKASAIEHYNQGRAKHNIGQYEAAIVDYNTAIRLKPDHALIYYDRGEAKYHSGQYEAAITDYDTFIRLKPDDVLNALAYWMRGLVKYKLGQYEAAIADYDIFIRLKPDYAREPEYACIYHLRGLAKVKLGQTREAEKDWQDALKLATQADNVELKNQIESLLHQSTGPQVKLDFKPKQEKVVHHSKNQVKTSDSAIDCYNRGKAKHDLGQYEEAIADYDTAIQLKPDHALRLKPNHALIYYNRAEAKRHLGLYGVAIWDYDAAIRLNSDYTLAYYNRGNAKAELGQTGEAKQDWQTALKLATKTNNVKLKSEIENVLRQFADSQVKPNFKPKQEKVVQHSENQAKTSTPQVKEKVVHYSEDQIKDIVADYFESLPIATPDYSVKREYLIQMGSSPRRADIVFLRNGKLVAIAECKRTGRIESGHEQLKAYLCATDTFLGIFANDSDPNKWTFWENHRHNNFLEIDRKTFENYVYNHDKAIKDREKKIKAEVQREIDAEIRERARENTDTNAIREEETNRIRQEVTANIDRNAIVNSVRSQIAEQAKNGLLNSRDEENFKLGRAQGFWWTILSIIGIGILIAMLTSA